MTSVELVTAFLAPFLVIMAAIGLSVEGPPWLRRRFASLRKEIARIETATGLEAEVPGGWFPKLTDVRFSGDLASGRGARVSFFQDAGEPHARISVDAWQVPSLVVRREGVLDRVGKWLGVMDDVEIGDRSFDEHFLVSTPAHEKTTSALNRGLKQPIASAFLDYGVVSLVFRGGVPGELEVTLPASGLSPPRYRSLLALLDGAADAFERVKVRVRALGGERLALKAAGGTARCAYCHAAVSGDEADLVACKMCATILHEGCWTEHGGCPILGCTGREPERARTA